MSTNATGLQYRLTCAVLSYLLRLAHGPAGPCLWAFEIPLTSSVDRRFSVHQC